MTDPCAFCSNDVREFHGNTYEPLYTDEQITILYDTKRNDKTYMLVYPRRHIKSLELISERREFNDCLSAINKTMWLGKLKDSFIFFSKDSIKDTHAHIHVQAENSVALEELKSKLQEGFYQDSEYYRETP